MKGVVHAAAVAAAIVFFLSSGERAASIALPSPCVGDCDGDGRVAINELVLAVAIALGQSALGDCLAVDADEDSSVAINELVRSVGHALQGCPPAPPTATPSTMSTASPDPTETAPPNDTPTPTVTPATPSPTSPPGETACATLQGLSSEGIFTPITTITSTTYHRPPASAREHCEIIGTLNPRTGVDGAPYMITYRLRLPTVWNGRFYFQGGAGTDGFLPNANPGPALAQGYAVVATDSGHDNVVNDDPARGGTAAFGFDPQARVDYGYNALDQVTLTAKALIVHYYGRGPEHSYLVGCSNGGRQGMMAAQRFPDHFDGIVAGDPAFNLPKAMIGSAWNVQAVATLATRTDVNGAAYLPDTFTTADLQLAADAILGACDALDGLADGIVDNFPACTDEVVVPYLLDIQCLGAKQPTCLSVAQISVLQTIHAGARDSQGNALYARWPWDAGLAGLAAMQIWSVGLPATPGQPLVNNAFNLDLGAGLLGIIFTTPPLEIPETGLAQFMFDFDFDSDAETIFATSDLYTQSAMEFVAAVSTDVSAFAGRGGKMIVYHGASDGVFSLYDTIDWYQDVDAASGGTAEEFMRFFAVPGMGHCFAGPATTVFNDFAALVAWVENGIAPDRIVATALPGTPWPGRTRPLCPYPTQARYVGTGSIEEESNFVCE